MHELSIAESLISTVAQEMEQRTLSDVKTVGVRIGVLSGVFPDALQFAFEMAVAETPLDGTKLNIETVPARGRCQKCGSEMEFSSPPFVCRGCTTNQIEMTSGFELHISYLEVEKVE